MIKRIKEMDILSKIILCLIIISMALIIMNGIKFYRHKVKTSTYDIVLLGDNPMIVYQEDKYVESGFIAKDYQNKEKNELVIITNNVNSNVIGNYQVTYEINNFFKKNKVVREVNVLENPLEDVKFSLKGKDTITLKRDSNYVEEGFNVVSDKGDFTKNVSVENNVDINKVGTYEVIYTLKIGNKEKSIKRIVNVTGNKCTATVDETEWTNQNVKVTVKNHLKDFDYFVNPNGIIVYDESFDFIVDKNDIYEFHLIDIHGIDEVIKVNVDNIDKTPPIGKCDALITGNKTAYSIETSDISGINKFIHNNKDYIVNSFVVDNIEENGEVTIYDNAGNMANVSCIADYDYIAPTGNYLYKYESPTLKYWIEDTHAYYKTTHIWVKDSYNQMKVGIPSKIGVLNTAKTILNKEIKNNDYENKGMVAINASGIVGGGFGTEFLNLKPSWVGTAAIPLIINDGKIIRDSTTKELPNVGCTTYGIKKNGYLAYYNFKKGNEVEYNTKIKEKIIDDGVKYTYGFSPVLVWDSKVKASSKEKNIRQGICQINRNNFVIITNTNSTDNRSAGLSHNDLANNMVKLGCKYGYNLDGGGSVNFYYKSNTKELKSIKSSNRGLVDMLYFVEK